MKFQKINTLIRIILLTSLLMIVSSAAASAPSGPISTVYEFSGSETWTSDIVFSEKGQLIVTGDLEISGAKISYTSSWNPGIFVPAITVKKDAVLTLSSGCIYDLSTAATEKFRAIDVEPGGKLILDNAEISGGHVNGYQNDEENKTIILVNSGELIIRNHTRIKENTVEALEYSSVIEINDGHMEIIDSTLSDNHSETVIFAKSAELTVSGNTVFNENHYSYPIWLYGGTADITGNILFEKNNAAVFVLNGTMNIGDGVNFIENSHENGGALLAGSSDISIGKAIFRGNTAYTGGAIMIQCGKLTLNGTQFLKNDASDGGAIYADTWNYDLETYDQNENAMILDITDAVFEDNTARCFSAALALSLFEKPSPRWGVSRNSITAFIHSAVFKNNLVEYVRTTDWHESSSAIFIGYDATAYIDDLAVIENNNIGIKSSYNGETYIYPRRGAVVYGNNNPYSTAGFADLLQIVTGTPPEGEKNTITEISEKMFNGGKFQWRFTEDQKNASSSPTNKDISDAKVLIQNNGYDPENTTVETSAIINRGLLYIGQEAISIPLEVQWIYPEDQAQEPPAPLAYLPSLILETAGQVYPFGELTEEQHTTAEDDTDNYIFRSSADIYLEIHVTDHHDGHWSITFIDLPKYQDGSELVFGLKSAAFPNYVTSIGGDMTDGFVVVNTFREQQDPSGDLVFSRLENMETLPRTGFPSTSSGTER